MVESGRGSRRFPDFGSSGSRGIRPGVIASRARDFPGFFRVRASYPRPCRASGDAWRNAFAKVATAAYFGAGTGSQRGLLDPGAKRRNWASHRLRQHFHYIRGNPSKREECAKQSASGGEGRRGPEFNRSW